MVADSGLLFNPESISKNFWEGIVAPRESWPRDEEGLTSINELKNWSQRVRVRIIGVNSPDKSINPDDQLIWAELPGSTMGSGHKGGGANSAVTQGTHVRGMWTNAAEKTGAFIIGIKSNNEQTKLNKKQETTDGFAPFSGYTEKDLVASYDIPLIPGNPMEGFAYPNIWGISDQRQQEEPVLGFAQPSECEKVPMGQVQKAVQGMIKDIERAQDQLSRWENTASGWITDKQDYIQKKIDIASNFVSRGMKWMIKETRKNVLETLNNETKKLYHTVAPIDRDKVKAAKDATLELLSCLYSKITKNLFKMIGDFLGKMVDRFINIPACAIENFIGGLMGNLLGTISGIVDSIMGSLSSILGGSFNIADSILGLLAQLAGFFKCDDKQECPESSEWDIFAGGQPDATFDIQSVLNSAKGLASDVKNLIDLDTLSGLNLDDMLTSATNAANACNVGPVFCAPPEVTFWGGGLERNSSNHARGNAIISAAGDILGVDIIAPGLGYIKEPFVTIKDNCGKGKGGFVRPRMRPDGGTNPDTGRPTFSVDNVIVEESGFGFPSQPNGDMGGDGRVWATADQTVVKRTDGKWQRFDPDAVITPEIDTTTPNVDGGIGDTVLKPENRVITGIGEAIIGPGGKVTPTTSSGVGVDGSGTESLDGDQPQEDRIARRKGTTLIPGTGPNGETDFNAFPALTVGSYPVMLYLCGLEIQSAGVNYDSNFDKVVIEPNTSGAEIKATFGPFGVLDSVEIINSGEGWTQRPEIYVSTNTGYNAVINPIFCVRRVGDDTAGDIPLGTPVVKVVDCVGNVNRGTIDEDKGYRIIESN